MCHSGSATSACGRSHVPKGALVICSPLTVSNVMFFIKLISFHVIMLRCNEQLLTRFTQIKVFRENELLVPSEIKFQWAAKFGFCVFSYMFYCFIL